MKLRKEELKERDTFRERLKRAVNSLTESET